jgi:hypothetical protein
MSIIYLKVDMIYRKEALFLLFLNKNSFGISNLEMLCLIIFDFDFGSYYCAIFMN